MDTYAGMAAAQRSRHERSEHVSAFRFYSGVMPAMLIAKFVGDVDELKAVYDRGHALIMERGGAVPFGELRHHCATSEDALYIIGVWESADHIRRRWADDEFKKVLASVGFPTEPTERMILDLHQIEPPL